MISTNRKFDQWIEDFKEFPIELQHAVAKRIVFFTLPDTALVKGELRKRKREDDRSAVEEGLRRERALLKKLGRTDVDVSAISTTASSSGGSSPALSSAGNASTPAFSADSTLDGKESSETRESEVPALVEEASSGRDAPRPGPNGPDGRPLFARLPEFVAVYLVFGADVLVRMGELDKAIFEHYLADLRALNNTLAKAYVETTHCSVSFLTDTTTLKLLKQWFSEDGQITAAAL